MSFLCDIDKLKDLKRSPDLLNNFKMRQGQLQLIMKHILFHQILGLQPFWSSDLKQSNEYFIKQLHDFWEKDVWIGMWQSKWEAMYKRSQVSLTFGTYIKPSSQCLRLSISCKYNFWLNSCGKMNISRFFSYKCIRNQIWPCHKVGQCQSRTIICANLVGPASPMLHTKRDTKSQGHWPFGSREVVI